MSQEQGGPTPEQVATSPIHQFMLNGGLYSPISPDKAVLTTRELLTDLAIVLSVPQSAHNMFMARFKGPLDELLIARGNYPRLGMTEEQRGRFNNAAEQVMAKYSISMAEGPILEKTFNSVEQVWVQGAIRENN